MAVHHADNMPRHYQDINNLKYTIIVFIPLFIPPLEILVLSYFAFSAHFTQRKQNRRAWFLLCSQVTAKMAATGWYFLAILLLYKLEEYCSSCLGHRTQAVFLKGLVLSFSIELTTAQK